MEETLHPKKRRRTKWADKAGDQTVVSARGNRDAGRYLRDLDTEMSEEIRVKPIAPGQKLSSVRPCCCTSREGLAEKTGELEFSTGKLQVGTDEKKKQMLFSFVRHENDAEGREVQENKASAFSVGGRDRFRSNDSSFEQGAMALRCDAAKGSKRVRKQFFRASQREGGDSTIDRVLPFQRRPEQQKLQTLREMQLRSPSGRTGIHTAMSGVRSLSLKKRQKEMEFKQKFYRVADKARARFRPDDSFLYIRRRQERLLQLGLLSPGRAFTAAYGEKDGFTPEAPVENNVPENIHKERS